MDIKNWKIDDDGAAFSSIKKIPILWAHQFMDVWIEIEDNNNQWSEHQKSSLDNFLSIHPVMKFQLAENLKTVYQNEIERGNIQQIEFENIMQTIDWLKGQVCVPQQYKSKNEYVFLLLETKWNIQDSESNLELEVLFTNNKIEIVQEMSGLWNRVEWFDYYLKREKLTELESPEEFIRSKDSPKAN